MKHRSLGYNTSETDPRGVKYKIGDRVRVVRSYFGDLLGTVGVVDAVHIWQLGKLNDYDVVTGDGVKFNFFGHQPDPVLIGR